jgi:hypothetical protein
MAGMQDGCLEVLEKGGEGHTHTHTHTQRERGRARVSLHEMGDGWYHPYR